MKGEGVKGERVLRWGRWEVGRGSRCRCSTPHHYLRLEVRNTAERNTVEWIVAPRGERRVRGRGERRKIYRLRRQVDGRGRRRKRCLQFWRGGRNVGRMKKRAIEGERGGSLLQTQWLDLGENHLTWPESRLREGP